MSQLDYGCCVMGTMRRAAVRIWRKSFLFFLQVLWYNKSVKVMLTDGARGVLVTEYST